MLFAVPAEGVTWVYVLPLPSRNIHPSFPLIVPVVLTQNVTDPDVPAALMLLEVSVAVAALEQLYCTPTAGLLLT